MADYGTRQQAVDKALDLHRANGPGAQKTAQQLVDEARIIEAYLAGQDEGAQA